MRTLPAIDPGRICMQGAGAPAELGLLPPYLSPAAVGVEQHPRPVSLSAQHLMATWSPFPKASDQPRETACPELSVVFPGTGPWVRVFALAIYGHGELPGVLISLSASSCLLQLQLDNEWCVCVCA